jgi:hypothetical protein
MIIEYRVLRKDGTGELRMSHDLVLLAKYYEDKLGRA